MARCYLLYWQDYCLNRNFESFQLVLASTISSRWDINQAIAWHASKNIFCCPACTTANQKQTQLMSQLHHLILEDWEGNSMIFPNIKKKSRFQPSKKTPPSTKVPDFSAPGGCSPFWALLDFISAGWKSPCTTPRVCDWTLKPTRRGWCHKVLLNKCFFFSNFRWGLWRALVLVVGASTTLLAFRSCGRMQAKSWGKQYGKRQGLKNDSCWLEGRR